jgi:hypothetical protein
MASKNIKFSATINNTKSSRLVEFFSGDQNISVWESEAKLLQEFQQKALQDRVRERDRPQERGNHLVEAIVASDNRQVRGDGFIVGQGLAEGSAQRYFRLIDQGTDIFVGRTLLGFFLDEGGRRLPPRPDAHDAAKLVQLTQGGGLRNTKGQFRSRALKSDESAHEGGRNGELPRGVFLITINKPIQPYDYIQVGFNNWLEGAKERIVTKLRENLRRNFR